METNLATQLEPATDDRRLAIQRHGKSLAEKARDFKITDHLSYQAACGILVEIKTRIGEAKDFCRPNIQRWHAGWKGALEDEKVLISPYEEAEKIFKPLIATYTEEQERRRLDIEAKAQAEANRQAEERQISQAAAAETAGHKELANAILETPVQVPTVVVPTATPKAEGISIQTRVDFQIIDPKLIPREFLMVDETKIRRYVAAMGETAAIPGVKVFKKQVVAAGRR